jgi:hypothetical protein
MEELIEVGYHDDRKKKVTVSNKKLYDVFVDVIDECEVPGKYHWHIGWYEIGAIVDHLEKVYGLEWMKDKANA